MIQNFEILRENTEAKVMSLFFQLYISQVTTLESVDYESVPKRHPPPPTSNSAVISCTKFRVYAWNI